MNETGHKYIVGLCIENQLFSLGNNRDSNNNGKGIQFKCHSFSVRLAQILILAGVPSRLNEHF